MIYELTDEDVGEELVDEADRDDEDSEEKREEVARNVRLAMGELMTALVRGKALRGAMDTDSFFSSTTRLWSSLYPTSHT